MLRAVIDEERPRQRTVGNSTLLQTIATVLKHGLATAVEPFPETDKECIDILKQLRELNPTDIRSSDRARLDIQIRIMMVSWGWPCPNRSGQCVDVNQAYCAP